MTWKMKAALALAAGYAITGLFGVPAVRHAMRQRAEDYRIWPNPFRPMLPINDAREKYLKQDGDFEVHRAVPIFPGVVLVRSSWSVGGPGPIFGAAGGTESIVVWYGFDCRVVWMTTSWIT
jgi:hypothetical protein